MVNRDLTDPRWLYLKGGLFLLGALMACAAIIAEHPTWKHAMLLALAVWCACRAYYFAFYVIEHYIDGEYKFAGLGSFVRYVLTRKKQPDEP
jgi:uncharacterized membrane-anchored protein